MLRLGRPALTVRGGEFEEPESGVWRVRLGAARDVLRRATSAVGRIELGEPERHIGTAWMVAPNIAVTNRHVAEFFARRRGDEFHLRTSPIGTSLLPVVDFRAEVGLAGEIEAVVAEVLYIADQDGPDLAFVRLEPLVTSPAPIPLSDATLVTGRDVVVIGYPAYDDRNDGTDQGRIFGDVYEVKRLSPGKVRIVTDTGFEHDCTTLGGSSGSVVIDLETGDAVGLHFGGEYLNTNYAVRASVIRDHLAPVLAQLNAGSAEAEPTHAASSAPRTSPVNTQVSEAPSASSLARRQGYADDFLTGFEVPLSVPNDGLRDLCVPTGNGIRLNYTHSSIVMHMDRRLAVFTAVNIDGPPSRR